MSLRQALGMTPLVRAETTVGTCAACGHITDVRVFGATARATDHGPSAAPCLGIGRPPRGWLAPSH